MIHPMYTIYTLLLTVNYACVISRIVVMGPQAPRWCTHPRDTGADHNPQRPVIQAVKEKFIRLIKKV